MFKLNDQLGENNIKALELALQKRTLKGIEKLVSLVIYKIMKYFLNFMTEMKI